MQFGNYSVECPEHNNATVDSLECLHSFAIPNEPLSDSTSPIVYNYLTDNEGRQNVNQF